MSVLQRLRIELFTPIRNTARSGIAPRVSSRLARLGNLRFVPNASALRSIIGKIFCEKIIQLLQLVKNKSRGTSSVVDHASDFTDLIAKI